MTDTRMPGRWLTDPTMDQLTDRAWRTFTGSLMWSNEAGTDGEIPKTARRFLHPEGVDSSTLRELLEADLWTTRGDVIVVPDWNKRMGQELAIVVEARRESNRQKAQASRDRARQKSLALTLEQDVTSDVTSDVTVSPEDRKGQDRQGQAEVLSTPKMRIVEPDPPQVAPVAVQPIDGFFPPGESPFGRVS